MSGYREFSSSDLIKLLPGLTNRQLQWWDERKFIQATRRDGHKRRYSYPQALMVALALELKSKSMSIFKIKKAIRYVSRLVDANDVDLLMLDAKMQPVIALNGSALLESAAKRPQPLVLLSLASVRDKLNRKVK